MMIIGVTDNHGSDLKYQLYLDWILRGNASIVIKKLSYRLNNLAEVHACDGIVMTGGGDVDPLLYHGRTNHPTVYGVDSARDDFERNVVDTVLKNDMPFLGICRGLQLANVHFGGTLIQDLAEYGHPQHSIEGSADPQHGVLLEQQSTLTSIAGTTAGCVNTYHHQAADVPGNGLRVTARSDDGIIEAMELAENATHPFFLLVQWHPERMKDQGNTLTGNIITSFMTAAHCYQQRLSQDRV